MSRAVYGADLEDAAVVGKRAGERAVKRLNPRKVATAKVPVVYDPRVSSSLLGHLAGAINGASIARGTSFLKDKMGQRIFGADVTIIDDPHRTRGLRSKPFDGEGAGQPRRAIDRRGRAHHLGAGPALGAPARPEEHRPRRARHLLAALAVADQSLHGGGQADRRKR